jgi:hypothetical protein
MFDSGASVLGGVQKSVVDGLLGILTVRVAGRVRRMSIARRASPAAAITESEGTARIEGAHVCAAHSASVISNCAMRARPATNTEHYTNSYDITQWQILIHCSK